MDSPFTVAPERVSQHDGEDRPLGLLVVASLTPFQKELARHALGLSGKVRRSYRNHFVGPCGADLDAWADLVANGLATKHVGSQITGGDDCYCLTQAGAEVALNRGESLCAEDWPQSKRRSRPQDRRRKAMKRAQAYGEKPRLERRAARVAWLASGLTYGALTPDSLADLRQRIGAEARLSGLIDGSYRAGRKKPKMYLRTDGSVRAAEVFCSAYYFESREAVTFNENGFVGIAGWADDCNAQPIIRAFIAWVEALQAVLPTASAESIAATGRGWSRNG